MKTTTKREIRIMNWRTNEVKQMTKKKITLKLNETNFVFKWTKAALINK